MGERSPAEHDGHADGASSAGLAGRPGPTPGRHRRLSGLEPGMTFRHVLLAGVVVAGLAISGAGVASVLMDLPQDATPAPADPIGDLLRDTSRTPLQPTPPSQPQTPPANGGQAPAANPTAPGAPAQSGVPTVAIQGQEVAVQEEVPEELVVEEEEVAPAPAAPATPPGVRQRRRIAVIQAVDKTTAETMRFEVEVGGRPVRFGKTLIFKARACEVSASDEMTEDAIAYMEVGVQPRGLAARTEARQVFRGWMFASSPSVSGMQHPVYDAWVVGCKA